MDMDFGKICNKYFGREESPKGSQSEDSGVNSQAASEIVNKTEENGMVNDESDSSIKTQDDIACVSKNTENETDAKADEHKTENTVSDDIKIYLDGITQQIEELSQTANMITDSVGKISERIKQTGRFSDEIINRLNQMNDLGTLVESQEAIIKKQHDASLKFNDDVIYKTQKPLIMELIGIADQIRMILGNKREDDSYDLVEALKDLEESVEASLSNNSVNRFRETDSDDTSINRRRQAVVGRETVSAPELDGHYKSITPGYEWTMPYLVVNSEIKLNKILEENGSPQTFSFVIRPEEVVKLTYKNDI